MAFELNEALVQSAIPEPGTTSSAFAPTTAVRYPRPTEFFRTAGPTHTMVAGIIKADETRYLIDDSVIDAVRDDLLPTTLVLAANPDGDLFIIPAPHVVDGARASRWDRTWLEAINRARTEWVRQPRRGFDLGRIRVATGDFGEPDWPTRPFAGIVEEAFDGRILADVAHPVIKRLRGEE